MRQKLMFLEHLEKNKDGRCHAGISWAYITKCVIRWGFHEMEGGGFTSVDATQTSLIAVS